MNCLHTENGNEKEGVRIRMIRAEEGDEEAEEDEEERGGEGGR